MTFSDITVSQFIKLALFSKGGIFNNVRLSLFKVEQRNLINSLATQMKLSL